MQEIIVEYRPIPFLWITRKVRGMFPESWEEVTPRQMEALSGLSESDSLPELVSVFTGLPIRICRRLDSYQLTTIWEITRWVKEERSFDRFIISSIKAGNLKLCSPLPRLRKVTFGQFIFCDMAFSLYLESKKAEDLDRFIASLYLPESVLFSDELPLVIATQLNRVPAAIKQAIVFNFALVRRWLANQYPLIFSIPEEENPNESEEKGEQGSGRPASANNKSLGSWIRVFDSLVGNDISRHQEYGNIPLHNVLRYLTHKTKESLKARSSLGK